MGRKLRILPLICSQSVAWRFYRSELQSYDIPCFDKIQNARNIMENISLLAHLSGARHIKSVWLLTFGKYNILLILAIRAIAAFRRENLSVLRVLHDQIPHSSGLKGRITSILQEVEARLVNALILHSPPVVRWRSRIAAVIPLCHQFTAGMTDAKKGERDDLIFVGRAEHYKGIDFIPRIVSGLRERGWRGRIILSSDVLASTFLRNMLRKDDVLVAPRGRFESLLASAGVGLLPYRSATQSALPGAFMELGIIPAGPAVHGLFFGFPESTYIKIESMHSSTEDLFEEWLDRIADVINNPSKYSKMRAECKTWAASRRRIARRKWIEVASEELLRKSPCGQKRRDKAARSEGLKSPTW